MARMTIVRYGRPSELDQAEVGSKCIVQSHIDESYELYLQTSKNDEKPSWELIGVFNSLSSQEYIDLLVSTRLGE